jgi:hypothetical protein
MTAARRFACLAAGVVFAAALLTVTGCRKAGDVGGETVPTPPRELVEKSLRMGKAPGANPQPPGGAAPAKR